MRLAANGCTERGSSRGNPFFQGAARRRGARLALIDAMSNEWQATGVWDAWLIDLLVGLGYDVDALTQMSAQERVDTVVAAAEHGRFDEATTAQLRSAGILQTDDN
jgi:hypothetical protein